MKLKFENFNFNILNFMRGCGYRFIERSLDDEWNFVRSLSGYDYPRFHFYLKQVAGALLLNLHLDQKKPSYRGTTRHSGEYEGEVVETEAKRIRLAYRELEKSH